MSTFLRRKKGNAVPNLCSASAAFALFASFITLLTGCAGMGTLPPGSVSGKTITGRVYGGQQPVTQSSVQLYAVGTHGYGSASTPLLANPVTSDSTGSFNITADYTCPTPSTTVYLVVTGGDPGLPLLADNRALVLMDLLGPCGNLGPNTFIVINELTTVAAAWAVAPFALDYAHIGSSPTNTQGLTNAVATAANLVNPGSGVAPGSAPAIATIPTATINTLGDVLASCVNTNGSTALSAPCGRLFSAVTPPGSSTPSETFAAALAIARNPAHNTGAIFGQIGSKAPFEPTLTSAPPDWTLAINWTAPSFSIPSDLAIDAQGNVWILSTPSGATSSVLNVLNSSGISATYSESSNQSGSPLANLAIDANGNPWISNPVASNILELNGSGALVSGPFTGGGILGPSLLAFDASGNIWIANSNPTVSELDHTGNPLSIGTSSPSGNGFPTSGTGTPNAIALDTAGNLWATDNASNNIYVIDYNGIPIHGSPYSGGGIDGPSALAIDTTGGAWVANQTGSSLSRLSSSGGPVSGSPYTGGGLNSPVSIALDGLDNVWLANSGNNTVSEFLSTGSPQSGTGGYASTVLSNPFRAAIDRSGNVWVANQGSTTPGTGVITQIVGAAAPIITPVALAIQNNVLDQRP